MRKKEYLAVHQLSSTLMSSDDISCYTVHAMEEWAWWHFWQGKKKVSIFFLLLITIQVLCNYWLERQEEDTSGLSQNLPLLFSPSQRWSHMLKEQPALPDHNYSKSWKRWSHRDSRCRYQPGLQRIFVAEIAAAQPRSTFLSSSQPSVLIDEL